MSFAKLTKKHKIKPETLVASFIYHEYYYHNIFLILRFTITVKLIIINIHII